MVHGLKAVIQLKIGPKKDNTVPTGFYRIVGYNNKTSGLVNINYLIEINFLLKKFASFKFSIIQLYRGWVSFSFQSHFW